MKVLVTGGGGFLGSAICRQLVAAGYTVCAFNRTRHAALDELKIEQRIGDIAHLDTVCDATADIDAVVHSAGKVGAWGKLEEFYDTNVRGTDNLLAACELNEIDKFVFTSSATVVHGGGDIEGVDESAPYATHFSSPYAQTKALAEQRVLAANGPGLATVALRPHIVWGPGDPNFLPRILEQARKGRFRLIGDAGKKVDTTLIDNAAKAHVLALQKLGIGSPIAGKAYFVTQGDPITVEHLVNSWLKAGGFPPETRRMPLGLAQFLATSLETIYQTLGLQREPPVTRIGVEMLTTAQWFNTDAARRDLGYTPTVSLAEGFVRLSQHLARERMSRRG